MSTLQFSMEGIIVAGIVASAVGSASAAPVLANLAVVKTAVADNLSAVRPIGWRGHRGWSYRGARVIWNRSGSAVAVAPTRLTRLYYSGAPYSCYYRAYYCYGAGPYWNGAPAYSVVPHP